MSSTTETAAGDSRARPVRRPVRRWRRVLVVVAVVAAVGVMAAMTGEAALARRDAARHPAPGELVRLPDGRDLHVQVAGAVNDGPTVVLDAGAGSFSSQWAHIQGQVAEFAPAVAYDRPGLGWSDPYRSEWDASTVAGDLVLALDQLGLPRPYVLVGHSLGATYARVFAHDHPDLVAGLVLVDPAHQDQYDLMEGADSLAMLHAMHVAARLGVLRATRPFDDLGVDMPSDAFAEWTARSYTAANARGFLEEGRTVLEVIAPQLQALDPGLGQVPLTVLRASDAEWPDVALMQDLQAELAGLSGRGRLVDVDGADHYSIVTDPAHARTVADAIAESIHTSDEWKASSR